MLLTIHIAAGGLAMILGALALLAKKGGTFHRRSGRLFVYAMLVMGFSASILGFLRSPTDGNVFTGLMTAYFVVTALTTVRPLSTWTRRIDAAALTVVAVLALGTLSSGVEAFNSPHLSPGGVPFRTIGVMSFLLATVMILAAAGDMRILRSGPLRGGPRLARHLWRMCFALFIAAGSFFSIRERVAKILPEPFRSGPLRALPILLLFGAMFYWLWRVRRRQTVPVIVRHIVGDPELSSPTQPSSADHRTARPAPGAIRSEASSLSPRAQFPKPVSAVSRLSGWGWRSE